MEDVAVEATPLVAAILQIEFNRPLIAIADRATINLGDSNGHEAAADSMTTVRNVTVSGLAW